MSLNTCSTNSDEEKYVVKRHILGSWILEALQAHGGAATVPVVCRYIWENHQEELRDGGDLFYIWQYMVVWAAGDLRAEGFLEPKGRYDKGPWRLRDKLPEHPLFVKQ